MINWIIQLWDKYQNDTTYQFIINYLPVDDCFILIINHTDITGRTYQVAYLTIVDNTVYSEDIVVGHFKQIERVFKEIEKSYDLG